jgi:hypothetical protein
MEMEDLSDKTNKAAQTFHALGGFYLMQRIGLNKLANAINKSVNKASAQLFNTATALRKGGVVTLRETIRSADKVRRTLRRYAEQWLIYARISSWQRMTKLLAQDSDTDKWRYEAMDVLREHQAIARTVQLLYTGAGAFTDTNLEITRAICAQVKGGLTTCSKRIYSVLTHTYYRQDSQQARETRNKERARAYRHSLLPPQTSTHAATCRASTTTRSFSLTTASTGLPWLRRVGAA